MSFTLAYAGDVVTLNVTSWNDLPFDMVELVLGKLSVQELARISATCSAFTADCRRRLAHEQAARCDLAAGVFGREGLIYLALLINRFVNGDPLDQEVVQKDTQAKWGLVEEVELPDNVENTNRKKRVYQAGDMHVEVTLAESINELVLCLPTLKGSLVHLHTRRWSAKLFNITMCNVGPDGDAFGFLEGMAFLQALLSGGSSLVSPNARLPGDVCIAKQFYKNRVSIEKVQTLQLAPLVPAMLRPTFAVLRVGCPSMIKERVQVGHVGNCMWRRRWPAPPPWPWPVPLPEETFLLLVYVQPYEKPARRLEEVILEDFLEAFLLPIIRCLRRCFI
jgi:hypothetical protein